MFEQVTSNTAVTDAGWMMVQGSYSFAGGASSLLLYIESPSATASYYVDDFSIRVVPAVGDTIAASRRAMRLSRLDLPAFGGPAIATVRPSRNRSPLP